MSRGIAGGFITNSLQSNPIIPSVFQSFKNGIIVSCQATAGTAIDTPEFIAAQAKTVESAGARAIRAQGIQNVKEIFKVVSVPIIGLVKTFTEDSKVYITPLVEDVLALVEAGANIIAVDATQRIRTGGLSLENFYEQVRSKTTIPLLADIDSYENGIHAFQLGFDAIATTLHGYTDFPSKELPNIDLVNSLANEISIPIIAEGGFASPEQVKNAMKAGAWSVCVGTAITNPYLITQHFVQEAF